MDRDSLVSHRDEVSKVLWVTFFLNEAVAVAKLAWGYATGSVGMVSDGFHSMFDGVTNIVGLVGIRISSMPPDKEHPYGHRKFESLFAVVVGLMIFGTCFEVLRRAVSALLGEQSAQAGVGSFLVMGITMAANVYVMIYEGRRGRELGSEFLVADAMHTKSNMMSSVGVLAGLVLTRLGMPMADSIAGLVVAVFIAKIGFEIIRTSADVLVDSVQVDADTACRAVMSVSGVLGCHDIRSRGGRNHICLDLHIQLPPDMSLKDAHYKTHEVSKAIRAAMPEIMDVILHTEPFKDGDHERQHRKSES